jgi:hypothetical protein
MDFHGRCEIETDGATDVTIVRHKASLTIFRWRWKDGLWCRGRTLIGAEGALFTFR